MKRSIKSIYSLVIIFALIGCRAEIQTPEVLVKTKRAEAQVTIKEQLNSIVTEYEQFSETCSEYEIVTAQILDVACMSHKVPAERANPIGDVVHAFSEEGWAPVGHTRIVQYFGSVKFKNPETFSLLEQYNTPCQSRIMIHMEKVTETEFLSTIFRLDCDLKPQGKQLFDRGQ